MGSLVLLMARRRARGNARRMADCDERSPRAGRSKELDFDPRVIVVLSIIAWSITWLPLQGLAQQSQGIYLDRMTILETTNPVAFLSTQNANEELVVTNYMAGAELYRATVASAQQVNGPTPWIDAGWSRSQTLPLLAPGFYMVGVDPASVVPSSSSWGHVTYQMPLFVVPTNPTADVLFVSPSLTNACYNDWGGRSCYTEPPNAHFGFRRPGYLPRYLLKLKTAIGRLQSLGYTWDVIDEKYLEANPGFAQNYRAVVVVGQPEYLTSEIRSAFDDYVDSGGRLLILGNEVWVFQVRRQGNVYSTYKFPWRLVDPFAVDGDPSNDHLIAYEWVRQEPGPNHPEIESTGVSTWLGYRPSEPFWTAWRTSHWFYEETGLSDGDHFREVGIAPVGFDQIYDGVKAQFWGGLPYTTQKTIFGIPDGVLILATIPTGDARPWNCGDPWNSGDTNCWVPGTAAITIRATSNGGAIMVIPDNTWFSDVPYIPIPTRLMDNALRAFASPAPLDVYGGFATEPRIPGVPGLSVWSIGVILLTLAATSRRWRAN
jgi:hypothetical protein